MSSQQPVRLDKCANSMIIPTEHKYAPKKKALTSKIRFVPFIRMLNVNMFLHSYKCTVVYVLALI